MADDLSQRIRRAGVAAGLARVGICSAEPFVDAREALVTRRERGLSADMQFTYRNPERSTDPSRALPGVRSLVVGALPYARSATDEGDEGVTSRVAAYAWRDHYADLAAALGVVAEVLVGAGHEARIVADDNALVDRAAAQRAGIGWYGKNANILSPGLGSWFVLGSVLTTAVLAPDEPMADGCGACVRCIDGCPTGAIIEPGVVDARRCLAWLVQAPGDFPLEYRRALGDRLYGCDECQEVCPPSRRAPEPNGNKYSDGSVPIELLKHRPAPRSSREVEGQTVEVLELLGLDDDELMARHGRWYVPERNPDYLRRNALVVLGNTADPESRSVVATVKRYLDDPNPMLQRHAAWAADELGLS